LVTLNVRLSPGGMCVTPLGCIGCPCCMKYRVSDSNTCLSSTARTVWHCMRPLGDTLSGPTFRMVASLTSIVLVAIDVPSHGSAHLVGWFRRALRHPLCWPAFQQVSHGLCYP